MKKPLQKSPPGITPPGAVSSAPRCNCSSAVTCRFGSCSMPNASSKKKLPYMDAMDVGKYQFIRFHKQFGGGSNNQLCKVHVKTGDIASFYIQVWMMFHWKTSQGVIFCDVKTGDVLFRSRRRRKKRNNVGFPKNELRSYKLENVWAK